MAVKSVEDLPAEVLLDILFRLPVESLGRLKCTSRFWYSMISEPNFVEMHLSLAIRNPGHFFSFGGCDPKAYFVEIVGDKFEGMKFSVGRVGYRAEKDNFYRRYVSSGGLMVCYVDSDKCYQVCNPITAEQVKLPHDPCDMHSAKIGPQWWGFSYCLTTREYKLVEFFFPKISNFNDSVRGAIYTLGSESWREIPNIPFRQISSFAECNGNLFWVVEVFDNKPGYYNHIGEAIWSLDIETEKFWPLQGPPSLAPRGVGSSLMKFGDTIGWVIHEERRYNIWILKDKVNGTWIKEYNLRREGTYSIWSLWMNGELFFRNCKDGTFATYDTNSREFRVVILPLHKRSDGLSIQPINLFSLAGSLISPRRIMGGGKGKSCW